MAYRRATKSGSSRRTKSTASRSYRGRSSNARRSTARGPSRARRSSSSPRTIRIVIEQPPANAVARPPIGMAIAPMPKKATF